MKAQPIINTETGVITFPPGFSFSRGGWHLSDETKAKMSATRKGKPLSAETKAKISKNNYFRGKHFTGESNPFYGKHHTEETKEKVKQMQEAGLIKTRKGQKNTPEHNAKIGAANKLAYSEANPETRAHNILISNNPAKKPENRKAASERRKAILEKKRGTPERAAEIAAWREKMDEWIEEHGHPLAGFQFSEESRQKMSETHKAQWQDSEYTEMMRKAIHQTPNIPEKMLGELLEAILPGQYSYTGDWAVFIDGINPDFIDNDGGFKVIEMFGNYWHRDSNPQDRIDKFAKAGFDCLVIWEREVYELEIDPTELINKILEFHGSQ